MHAYCKRCILLTFRQEELPVVGKTVLDVRKIRTRNRSIPMQLISELRTPLKRLNKGLCTETVRSSISYDGQGKCERA